MFLQVPNATCSSNLSYLAFHICKSTPGRENTSVRHASCIFIPISRILNQVLTHFRSMRLIFLYKGCWDMRKCSLGMRPSTVVVNKSLRNIPVVCAYYASTVARSTQEVRQQYMYVRNLPYCVISNCRIYGKHLVA